MTRRHGSPLRYWRWRLRATTGAVLVLVVAAACSDDQADPTAFCASLREATALGAPVQELDLSDSRSVDRAVADLEGLQKLAPGEIADDVDIVMTTYRDVIQRLAVTSGAAREDALRDFEQQFTDVVEPARRLNDFARANCGMDLGGSRGTQPTPTPSGQGREG